MTMLDGMRRHKNWLKWSLFLVVVAFIALYFPDFIGTGSSASLNAEVARVGDERISAATFRRVYQRQMQAYSQAYGGSVNQQMLKQLGVDQQILRQLIDERAAVAEAKRLGLTISDAEVAHRIFAIPAFQQNGVFAGEQLYAQILASQNPPLTKAEFEDNLRQSLLVDKLRAALTDWVAVTNSEIEAEFTRRNEKVKAEIVVFNADGVRDQVLVTDADVAAFFELHKEDYRIGERRKIKYALVDVEQLRARAVVLPGEVEKYYRDNEPQYTTPEQVRASHILLKTEGKDEAAVKARAEALLTQVKGGADFAALARKESEDDQSKAQGGDLDYFGRGRMVKEFEEVAFSLPVGQVSDLVKSSFGFHIIRVTDKKPEARRSLDQVRQQITDQLAFERAQTQASALADQIAKDARTPADLDRVASSRGLTVAESGYFTRDEPIAALGPAPDVTSRAFELKDGELAGPVRVSRGLVIFSTSGKEASKLPAPGDVKERVREDALRGKAREMSQKRAEGLAAEFKTDFAGAAKRAGLEPKATELVARGTAWPDAGISAGVDEAIFALPVGGVSAPITTDAGTVLARVVAREDAKADALATARDTLRQELLADRKSKFYTAYMNKARERLKVTVNPDVVKAVVG
ncbi:MAG: SurA N-terminal domain-containing protein [Vicinamibacteria bacterium]|nr:SurA N-terminal domain-containing protein [Vicinamibacteria bacterium]